MAAKRDIDGPSLEQRLIWGTLNALSGRSKPISRKPMSSYRKFTPKPAGNKMSSYQPPPLTSALARRKNCITPPPEEQKQEKEGEGFGKTIAKFEQKQSPLLRLLPEEVLVQIYEYVLGGRRIHLVRRSRSLSHAICKNENGDINECRQLKCRGTKLPNGVSLAEKGSHGGYLSLLQACRKMYIKAIQILYTTNTFSFDSMESLLSLSTSILPHRFDSILHLELDFRFDQSHFFHEGTPSTDYARWERTWRIIGSMKELQFLRCRIVWWRNDITGAEEKRYLGELAQVGGLQVFVVELLGLKWGDEKVVDGEGGFVVVRRALRR